MEKHYGQIIEKTIRRKNFSISELARMSRVNRRSIYNLFDQPKVKPELIYKIGCVLKHDFSNEFPELFCKDDFEEGFHTKMASPYMQDPSKEVEKVNYWKDKYINLLEEYNQVLIKR